MKKGDEGTPKAKASTKRSSGAKAGEATKPSRDDDSASTALVLKHAPAAPKDLGPVDRAVDALRRLRQLSTLTFAIDVGRIVVEHIFDGDLQEARRKGPKAKTLQELADRPDLPISARQLSVAVGIYELLDRTGLLGEVTTWELLGYSHVRALLPAPPKEQARLLEDAREKQWTVAQLTTEVAKVVTKPKGGRRRSSAVAKAVRALEADVDRLTKAIEKNEAVTARETSSINNILTRVGGAIKKLRRQTSK